VREAFKFTLGVIAVLVAVVIAVNTIRTITGHRTAPRPACVSFTPARGGAHYSPAGCRP
jgi:hypothetical protein